MQFYVKGESNNHFRELDYKIRLLYKRCDEELCQYSYLRPYSACFLYSFFIPELGQGNRGTGERGGGGGEGCHMMPHYTSIT